MQPKVCRICRTRAPTLSIETAHPTAGAEPHTPLTILREGGYSVVDQAIGGSQMGKTFPIKAAYPAGAPASKPHPSTAILIQPSRQIVSAQAIAGGVVCHIPAVVHIGSISSTRAEPDSPLLVRQYSPDIAPDRLERFDLSFLEVAHIRPGAQPNAPSVVLCKTHDPYFGRAREEFIPHILAYAVAADGVAPPGVPTAEPQISRPILADRPHHLVRQSAGGYERGPLLPVKTIHSPLDTRPHISIPIFQQNIDMPGNQSVPGGVEREIAAVVTPDTRIRRHP